MMIGRDVAWRTIRANSAVVLGDVAAGGRRNLVYRDGRAEPHLAFNCQGGSEIVGVAGLEWRRAHGDGVETTLRHSEKDIQGEVTLVEGHRTADIKLATRSRNKTQKLGLYHGRTASAEGILPQNGHVERA